MIKLPERIEGKSTTARINSKLTVKAFRAADNRTGERELGFCLHFFDNLA